MMLENNSHLVSFTNAQVFCPPTETKVGFASKNRISRSDFSSAQIHLLIPEVNQSFDRNTSNISKKLPKGSL